MRTLAILTLVSLALAGCSSDTPEDATTGTADGDDRSIGGGPGTDSGTDDASSDDGTTDDSSTDAGTDDGSTDDGSGDDANAAPTATLEAEPASGEAPLEVSFTLAGEDADGDALSWELDVDGDGTVDEEGTTLPTTVTHTYEAAGDYTATLTVTDGIADGTATADVAVAAGESPEEPVDPLDALCPTDGDAIEIPGAGHYITPMDNAVNPPSQVGTLWLYEESNGRPGLQRNDDTVPTQCPSPDTIIF